MPKRSLPSAVFASALSLALPMSACVVDADPSDGDPAATGRTTFGWRVVDSAITPVWGASVADGLNETMIAGGVAGPSAPVLPSAERVGIRNGGFIPADTINLDVGRFCGCAFVDTDRHEMVVIGGRDGRFADIGSAAVVDLDDGSVTDLGPVLPAQHPVGCQAFYLPATSAGYVFSGLSSNQAEFGDTFARWDGATRTFVEVVVDGASPPARYDATVHALTDHTVLMLSGMGLAANRPVFHKDAWTFDGTTEQWLPVAFVGDDVPAGRRYAWSAVGPDDDTVLFGLGSDSPQGQTMLSDLWRLSLGQGTWQRLDGVLDDTVDGRATPVDVVPAVGARAFASRLPGLPGTAGLLNGGLGPDMSVQTTAFVLDVPEDLAGDWR